MSYHLSAIWMLFACVSTTFALPSQLCAQIASPPSTSPGPSSTPPSMVRTPISSQARSSGQLPRDANQEYVEYDLRPYTEHLNKIDKPEMAIVDWVLRTTGDPNVWFSKPFGFMSADRTALSVYHTPAIQDGVKKLVDRFVQGPTDAQVLKIRLMTVSNPNWRARALPLIQDHKSQSPGIQAWLVTKENAAVLASLLRQRTDTKEIQDAPLPIYNGQSEVIKRVKSRNYMKTIRQTTAVWPPYEPEIGEIQEGYQLEFCPLLDTDGENIDCVIKAHIDQVDKLVPVDIQLPLPNNQTYRSRLEVPQVVSWRLDEQFRWNKNMVLLLSCGVIASPDRKPSIPLLNLDRLVGNTPGRADALLFIEYGGRAAEGLPSPALRTASPTTGVSRGRY